MRSGEHSSRVLPTVPLHLVQATAVSQLVMSRGIQTFLTPDTAVQTFQTNSYHPPVLDVT